MRRLLILLWVIPGMLCLASQPALAQESDAADGPLAGHSLHGDAYNEGPRQKAYLMEGTGKVDFPVTTKSPLAQRFFNQGVGQLHGFWYFEAERSFRQVAAMDTNCAMAYWGMAMANVNNTKRAKEFIKTAAELNKGLPAREAAWINCWSAYYKDDKRDNKEHRKDLSAGLEKIARNFPADLEAKAFLALQIWDNSSHGIALKDRQPVEDDASGPPLSHPPLEFRREGYQRAGFRCALRTIQPGDRPHVAHARSHFFVPETLRGCSLAAGGLGAGRSCLYDAGPGIAG
jgi:hypothetical protein